MSPTTSDIPTAAESVPLMPNTKALGSKPNAETTSAPAKRPALKRILWLVRSVPTILVLAVLAGIGFWGHHNNWTMPKFSALVGNGKTEKDDWCAEHGVPESICVACNAELMSKGKLHGWCEQHGGIVFGNEYIAGAANTSFGFKKGQIFFSEFVGFHR